MRGWIAAGQSISHQRMSAGSKAYHHDRACLIRALNYCVVHNHNVEHRHSTVAIQLLHTGARILDKNML